jgi:hypothetical protein
MKNRQLDDPSYQTAPLSEYSPILRTLAARLFDMVRQRIGVAKTIEYDGSLSVLNKSQTVAKIIIFEEGKGKMNGRWPSVFPDGVYVLIRTSGNTAARLWDLHRGKLHELMGLDISDTMGVAPNHDTRFAYARLTDDHDLRKVADLIASMSQRV